MIPCDRMQGCLLERGHLGHCGAPRTAPPPEVRDALSTALGPESRALDRPLPAALSAMLDHPDSQVRAAAQLLRDVFGGSKRVEVIGTRERGVDPKDGRAWDDPGSTDGWDPRTRSVYGFEPAAAAGENEFGEGGSVTGYSEAERKAAYRAFIKIRRALVELAEAKSPAEIAGRLAAVYGPIDPTGQLVRQLGRALGSGATVAPVRALPGANACDECGWRDGEHKKGCPRS